MQMPDDIRALAHEVITRLKAEKLSIATAESCTGGLVAGALTSISGSSDAVYGGFVTYANEAKIAMVGVPYALLKQYGAVSRHTAMAMAEGAMHGAGVNVAVAITGIAGPNGGSEEKPVGLVHFAVASEEETRHLQRNYDPHWTRDQIRHASVADALKLVLKAI